MCYRNVVQHTCVYCSLKTLTSYIVTHVSTRLEGITSIRQASLLLSRNLQFSLIVFSSSHGSLILDKRTNSQRVW